jgi:hypothetical protein
VRRNRRSARQQHFRQVDDRRRATRGGDRRTEFPSGGPEGRFGRGPTPRPREASRPKRPEPQTDADEIRRHLRLVRRGVRDADPPRGRSRPADPWQRRGASDGPGRPLPETDSAVHPKQTGEAARGSADRADEAVGGRREQPAEHRGSAHVAQSGGASLTATTPLRGKGQVSQSGGADFTGEYCGTAQANQLGGTGLTAAAEPGGTARVSPFGSAEQAEGSPPGGPPRGAQIILFRVTESRDDRESRAASDCVAQPAVPTGGRRSWRVGRRRIDAGPLDPRYRERRSRDGRSQTGDGSPQDVAGESLGCSGSAASSGDQQFEPHCCNAGRPPGLAHSDEAPLKKDDEPTAQLAEGGVEEKVR